jgi:hypothetical protein
MAVVKDCLKNWHVLTRSASEIKRDAGLLVAFGIEVTERRDPEFVNRTLPNSQRDMGLGHATRSLTRDEDAGQEVSVDVSWGALVGHLW